MAPCPACGGNGPFEPVETWHDRVGGKDYGLHRCEGCGVTFSEPRVPVGADWYEKAAPLRGKEYKPGPEKDFRFALFLSEPLEKGRVLDVGCGDGGFLFLARSAGWASVGFDYDSRMTAAARAKGEKAVSDDFDHFISTLKPGEFDAMTLFDVLEHTPEPARLLESIKPALRAGGHLAITLPNANRPILLRREEHDYPPHHFTRWTPEAMRVFLEQRGFAVERQVAGDLRVDYVSDHLFFFGLMPLLLGAAKALLFGRGSAGTVSELYAASGPALAPEPGSLADPLVRQRLVEWAKLLACLVTWPAALLLVAYFRATRELAGDSLYTLARKR